jgi:general secretion pathway protein I
MKRNGLEGFTLLEILVALSLIGIALAVVFQLFAANSRSIAASESYVHAAAHAEAVMRSILEDEKFPDATLSGITEDGYRYEASVTKGYEERVQALNVDLYQVKATIYWHDGAREKSLSLQTLKMTEKKI